MCGTGLDFALKAESITKFPFRPRFIMTNSRELLSLYKTNWLVIANYRKCSFLVLLVCTYLDVNLSVLLKTIFVN